MPMLGSGPIAPDAADAAGYPIAPDNTSSGSVTDSGTNMSLSGLSGLFSSVGSAFSNAYRAVNPVVTSQRPGDLVYNPATGTYSSVAGINAAGIAGSTMTPLILLLLGGVVIFMIVRK